MVTEVGWLQPLLGRKQLLGGLGLGWDVQGGYCQNADFDSKGPGLSICIPYPLPGAAGVAGSGSRWSGKGR